MLAENITTPTTCDNSLSPWIKWYQDSNFYFVFNESSLKQKSSTYNPPNRITFFSIYELDTWSGDLNSDFNRFASSTREIVDASSSSPVSLSQIAVTKPVIQTEDLNLSIFNKITGINESKTLTRHISCKSKCKFVGRRCNSNQKWHNDKCWCECKKHQTCEKIVFAILLHVVAKMVNNLQVSLMIQ